MRTIPFQVVFALEGEEKGETTVRTKMGGEDR